MNTVFIILKKKLICKVKLFFCHIHIQRFIIFKIIKNILFIIKKNLYLRSSLTSDMFK